MEVYSEIHILVASSTLGQRQNLVKINARELLMTRGSINKLTLCKVQSGQEFGEQDEERKFDHEVCCLK